MKVARTCRAEEASVKLCFFVKVLKARGLKVAGGRITGSIVDFAGAGAGLKGRIGWTGVAKPGEEEGIGLSGAGVGGDLKIGAARDFSD
jgi:hypothetical protein